MPLSGLLEGLPAASENQNRRTNLSIILAGTVVTYRHFDGVVEVSESVSMAAMFLKWVGFEYLVWASENPRARAR